MKFPKPEELILFEDKNFLALNKPAMITSEHDSSSKEQSLANLIKKARPEAMLCHRLDKETSGVIIAAKNEQFYRFFSMLLEDRAAIKEYHALVKGQVQLDDREIDLPIAKKNNRKGVIDRFEGKEALTIVNTRQVFRNYSLLEAFPVTGRFHQIRVHLAAIGYPIVGDALYGGEPFYLSSVKRKFKTGKHEEEQPVLARAALHAAKISFAYPDEESITIEAPYSKDMDISLKLLKKYDQIDHSFGFTTK